MSTSKPKSIDQHWKNAREGFIRLKKCQKVYRDHLPMGIEGKGGVYVFFDQDGSALYVGRGRNVRQRVLQHSRPSIKDGPFAWLLARDLTKRFPDYTSANSRETLLNDPKFRSALEKAKSRIAKMTVAYVVEDDDTTQCLLEVYAAVKLKARHNSFRTT